MLDSSIYQAFGVKPKSVAEFDHEANQRDMNALQLLMGRQKADEYTQGVAETNRLRQVFAGGADLSTPEGQRAAMAAAPFKAGGLIKDYGALQEAAAKAGHLKAQTGNETFKLDQGKQQQAIQRVLSMSDPSHAAADIDAQVQAGAVPPQLGEMLKRSLPADPAQFPQWQLRMAAGVMDPTKMADFLKPHLQAVNAGGTTQMLATDPLTTQSRVTGVVPHTQTPDNIATNAARTANTAATVGVQRDRLAFDQQSPKGVVHETDAGTMVIDPRTGAATPVTAADGTALSKAPPALKVIPASANKGIITNSQNLSKARQALELLQGKQVGALEGDPAATGWKGYAPGAVLNRMDPKGIDTRGMIADLGSMEIHDRSGAAVTAAEFPRLAPFIPSATDSAETAKKKLVRFVQVYEQEQQALAETYSKEQGYRPNPLTQPGGSPASAPAASPKLASLPPDIAAILKKHGGK